MEHLKHELNHFVENMNISSDYKYQLHREIENSDSLESLKKLEDYIFYVSVNMIRNRSVYGMKEQVRKLIESQFHDNYIDSYSKCFWIHELSQLSNEAEIAMLRTFILSKKKRTINMDEMKSRVREDFMRSSYFDTLDKDRKTFIFYKINEASNDHELDKIRKSFK